MTAAERTAFTAAVRAVLDPDAGFPVDFSAIHRASKAHGSPTFLPWHRLFLLEFEDALRSVDPSVALPYCMLCGVLARLHGAGGPRTVRSVFQCRLQIFPRVGAVSRAVPLTLRSSA